MPISPLRAGGLLSRPAPSLEAVLELKVLLLMVSPPPLYMPPPPVAELLSRVLLLIDTVPPVLRKPPPRLLGAHVEEKVLPLLLRVLLLMVSVPPLLRIAPPPMKEGKGGGETAPTPWAMVRALRVKLTPPFTESTCTLLPPSRVTDCPLPSRVMLPEIVSVLVMTISALQLKVMVSPLLSLLA